MTPDIHSPANRTEPKSPFQLFFLFSLLPTLLAGCATGPWIGHETGRSLGKSHTSYMLGAGQTGYVFKANLGVSENTDVGLQAEAFSTGVFAKYSFINNKESGGSVAIIGGAGFTDGKYIYSDLVGSYLSNDWEPYMALRVGRVHQNTRSLDFYDTRITFDQYDYTYKEAILGVRYWFTPKWFVSLEANRYFFPGATTSETQRTYGGASIGLHY